MNSSVKKRISKEKGKRIKGEQCIVKGKREMKEKDSATLDALLPFINAEINDENIEKFGFTFFVKDIY